MPFESPEFRKDAGTFGLELLARCMIELANGREPAEGLTPEEKMRRRQEAREMRERMQNVAEG
jgi:hypothetical protein